MSKHFHHKFPLSGTNGQGFPWIRFYSKVGNDLGLRLGSLIISPIAIGCLRESEIKQVKSFNTARVVKQMSTLMLKYAIYAFSVEKQLKSVLNI